MKSFSNQVSEAGASPDASLSYDGQFLLSGAVGQLLACLVSRPGYRLFEPLVAWGTWWDSAAGSTGKKFLPSAVFAVLKCWLLGGLLPALCTG